MGNYPQGAPAFLIRPKNDVMLTKNYVGFVFVSVVVRGHHEASKIF